MKKSEIRIGGQYIAKVSNKLTTITVREIVSREKTRYGKTGTRYYCVNDKTGRDIVFRSTTKFYREVMA